MYLVGDFSGIREEGAFNPPKKVLTITKDDLLKAKMDSDHQIIDVMEMKYFNPDKNEWIKIRER